MSSVHLTGNNQSHIYHTHTADMDMWSNRLACLTQHFLKIFSNGRILSQLQCDYSEEAQSISSFIAAFWQKICNALYKGSRMKFQLPVKA